MKLTRKFLSLRVAESILARSSPSPNSEKEKLNQWLSSIGLGEWREKPRIIDSLSNCILKAKAGNSNELDAALQAFSKAVGSLSTDRLRATAALLASVAPRELSDRIIRQVAWHLGEDKFEPIPAWYMYSLVDLSLNERVSTLGYDTTEMAPIGPNWEDINQALKEEFPTSLNLSEKMSAKIKDGADDIVTALRSEKRGNELLDEISTKLECDRDKAFGFLMQLISRLKPELSFDKLFDAERVQQLNNITQSTDGVEYAAQAFIAGTLDSGQRSDLVQMFIDEPLFQEFVTDKRYDFAYGEAQASPSAVERLQSFGELASATPVDRQRLEGKLNSLLQEDAPGLEDLAFHYAKRLNSDPEFLNEMAQSRGRIHIPKGKSELLDLGTLEKLPLDDDRVLSAIMPWLWTLDRTYAGLSMHETEQRQTVESLLLRGKYSENAKFLQKLKAFADSPISDLKALYRVEERRARENAESLIENEIHLSDLNLVSSGIDKLSNSERFRTRKELIAAARFVYRDAVRNSSVNADLARKLANKIKDLPENAASLIIDEWLELDKNATDELPLHQANATLALKIQFLAASLPNALTEIESAIFDAMTPKQRNQLREVVSWACAQDNAPFRFEVEGRGIAEELRRLRKENPNQTYSFSAKVNLPKQGDQLDVWQRNLLPGVSDELKVRFLQSFVNAELGRLAEDEPLPYEST